MLLFYLLLLTPFIQNSFSLIEEETDLNSLSNYETVDDLNENSEIWNTENDDVGIIIFENPSPSLLESICKNSNTLVYISQEDVTIDCKAFNNDEQPVDETENIVKRSVDEQELEGSGDEQPEESATTFVNEPAPVETDPEKKESEPEAGETNTQETDKNDEPQHEDTQVDAGQDAVDGIGETHYHNSEEPETTPENVQEISEADEPETSPVEETTPNQEDVQETTAPSEENQSSPVPTAEEQQTSLNQEPETFDGTETPEKETGDEQKEVEKPEETGDKTTEVDPNSQTGDKTTEVDPNSQTGDKTPEDPKSQVERTNNGRTLINPRDKEEMKEPTDDEGSPPTDQSTQDTKKAGSKDTTILIVLFAAVVVVGSLAFAYNFIKKRRQQNADLERLERAPSIKRSIQNLAQKDLEPEKKPLIGDDKKEVEMVDMKKDNSTNETTVENGISETTVKT